MANEALKGELNCSICLDTYTNPKILQCFHVFCQKCLVKLVVRDQQGQLSLSCPNCRQVTPVPANGTAGLQSAFHINRLLEILQQHNGVVPVSGIEECSKIDEMKSVSAESSAICCSEHNGREVELFCETCEKLICLQCAIKGGQHHSHDYRSISESFERYQKQIRPSLEPMEKQMRTVIEALAEMDRHCAEIAKQQGSVEAEIRERSKRLHEIIDKRESELIGRLEKLTRRKLKSLAAQRDQIETFQAQLNSCLEFTKRSLEPSVQQPEVLVMKSSILKQVQEVSKQKIFTLHAEADLTYSTSASAAVECANYGRVYALDSPDPSKCAATGKGTSEAVVGERGVAFLEPASFKGKICSDAVVFESFEIELVSEIDSNSCLEIKMKRSTLRQFEISYQPVVKGRHQLHIKADGQHITGSPFSVTVTQPIETLGSPIQTYSDVRKPWGLAVNRKGEVVVTEWDRQCVSVFSSRGEKLRSFGTHGSGEGQFDGPSGVAVDGDGNILVADFGNHRIQKFSADGQFLKIVGNKGSGAVMLSAPCGIAYSPRNNKIYVTDKVNHHVLVLNCDLTFSGMFGRGGNSKGHFDRPCGIATDNTGRVYVADSGKDRIQVFTAEGKFLRLYQREDSPLDLPHGVAVDFKGFLYICEGSNHRVSVLAPDGGLVASFGGWGEGEGEFDCPRGLAVDGSGVVYVCDSGNNRVLAF